jgi:hypothetical protein
VIKVRVIDLPKEGLTAQLLEDIINKFIEAVQPEEIIQLEFNSEFAYLLIIYKKG